VTESSVNRQSYGGAGDYYRDLRDRSDLAAIAHELLGGRITQETRSTISIDCPRHESQSGRSFQVSLHQGAWYCHACRVGGGAIELVEFVHFGTVTKCSRSGVTDTHCQARDWLAEHVGMPKLSEAGLSPEKIAEKEKLRVEAEQVFACLSTYAEICHEELVANEEVRGWLAENYAISDASIAQHRIGWAADASAFQKLVERGFAPEIIESAGIFRLDLASPAPFFRKRIVFPFWADGRVIYMTGRRTPWSEDSEWEQVKYKKLPLHDEKNRPKVSKAITNSALFGEDILRTRPRQVVLTEGITDAVASMQAGFATISPATVNIKGDDFQRIAAKLKGVEGVQIVFDNELSAVGNDAAVDLARSLDRAGVPCEIVTLALREKQKDARAAFNKLLGAKAEEYATLPAGRRSAFLREALADRPADIERAKELIAQAKIDVNEWFLTGGTAQEFATLLVSGKNYIAYQIESLRTIEKPDDVDRLLEPLLRDIASQGPVAQDMYLKALSEKTHLSLGALRKKVAAFAQDDRSEKRQKKQRERAESGTKAAYRSTPNGLVMEKPVDGGFVEVPLTNFTARIIATIIVDDGSEQRIRLEIEAQVRGTAHTVQVAAQEFNAMAWVMEFLGPRAIIYAGFSLKDHARVAIQSLSGETKTRMIYAHAGWREVDGHGWCYLHGGGAIGAAGLVGTIEVQLPDALGPMLLPKPPMGEGLVRSVRAALGVLDLGPDRVVVALFAALWRAVLGGTDFSPHLAGPTGVFKSEVASLIQSFFGAGFNARHLPGSWSSTGNALEVLLFAAKDMVTVVDDFAPTGSSHDVQRCHREADRVIRAVGNRSGRGRLRPDGSLRPVHAPRGVALSTGEDIPAGQSLRARMVILELEDGDIDPSRLSQCQKAAADGLHAKAMSGFLQWLAPQLESVQKRLAARELELRSEQIGRHRRTPSVVAQLLAGVEVFLAFAVEVGAIDSGMAAALRERSARALRAAAEAQSSHILAGEPTATFFELLRSAIAAGEAHVADPNGEAPGEENAVALGWEMRIVGTGVHERDEWVHKGKRVGWIDGANLYLDLPAAFRAAQGQAGEVERLSVTMRTLSKRLGEKGHLVSKEEGRGKHTIRRVMQGARMNVLHLRSSVLLSGEDASRAEQHEVGDAGEEGVL